MKLKDTRESYQFFSGKASEIVRQLGFAGIAVIWVFKVTAGERQIVPTELLPAGILLVSGLTLDLLHYVTGTLIWGVYNRNKEKQLNAESESTDVQSTNAGVPIQLAAQLAAQQLIQQAINNELERTNSKSLPIKSIVESTAPAEEEEFYASPFLNWPIISFFWLKIISILAAYVLLIDFLVRHVR